MLRADDQLADRTYNVFEQFLDTTHDALKPSDLHEVGNKRAAKFNQQCEMSWKHINRDLNRDGTIAWAGDHAKAHPPQTRRVIASLIRPPPARDGLLHGEHEVCHVRSYQARQVDRAKSTYKRPLLDAYHPKQGD